MNRSHIIVVVILFQLRRLFSRSLLHAVSEAVRSPVRLGMLTSIFSFLVHFRDNCILISFLLSIIIEQKQLAMREKRTSL